VIDQGGSDYWDGGGFSIDPNAFTNSGTIDADAKEGALYIDPTSTFTNSGTIEAEAYQGGLYVDPTSTFTNSGTIDVANGGFLYIEPASFTTTVSSVIAIEASSSATIDPTNAWTNLGSITLASGASLYLYGTVSAASLGAITNSGGTVYVGGTWDNSGQTLNGSGSFGELTLDGGTISGGTVTSAGVAFTSFSVGTLSGVTFDGPLNLTAFDASVDLANGTTVVGSSGSGLGTINVGDASLGFDNTQTVSNETINLGGGAILYEGDTDGAGNQVLTLASSVTVDVQAPQTSWTAAIPATGPSMTARST
jgi:hypothetical protein